MQRNTFGAITIARLLASILVRATTSDLANICKVVQVYIIANRPTTLPSAVESVGKKFQACTALRDQSTRRKWNETKLCDRETFSRENKSNGLLPVGSVLDDTARDD